MKNQTTPRSFDYSLQKMLLGLILRCPNCGKGRTFKGLFKPEVTCDVCHVRFEREAGESVGGMYINLAAAEVLSVGGYFLTQLLFRPPFTAQIIFWVTFNLAFVILFYRHSRSLWTAVTYLNGGVVTDEEFERRQHTT